MNPGHSPDNSPTIWKVFTKYIYPYVRHGTYRVCFLGSREGLIGKQGIGSRPPDLLNFKLCLSLELIEMVGGDGGVHRRPTSQASVCCLGLQFILCMIYFFLIRVHIFTFWRDSHLLLVPFTEYRYLLGILCLSQVDIFRLQSSVVNISEFKIVQSHWAITVILTGACQYCLDRRK